MSRIPTWRKEKCVYCCEPLKLKEEFWEWVSVLTNTTYCEGDPVTLENAGFPHMVDD